MCAVNHFVNGGLKYYISNVNNILSMISEDQKKINTQWCSKGAVNWLVIKEHCSHPPVDSLVVVPSSPYRRLYGVPRVILQYRHNIRTAFKRLNYVWPRPLVLCQFDSMLNVLYYVCSWVTDFRMNCRCWKSDFLFPFWC